MPRGEQDTATNRRLRRASRGMP